MYLWCLYACMYVCIYTCMDAHKHAICLFESPSSNSHLHNPRCNTNEIKMINLILKGTGKDFQPIFSKWILMFTFESTGTARAAVIAVWATCYLVLLQSCWLQRWQRKILRYSHWYVFYHLVCVWGKGVQTTHVSSLQDGLGLWATCRSRSLAWCPCALLAGQRANPTGHSRWQELKISPFLKPTCGSLEDTVLNKCLKYLVLGKF